MSDSRRTLEAHLAALKAQELAGDDILRPFPARADFDGAKDQPCLVTAVLERTAVVVPHGTPLDVIHSGAVTKCLLNLRRITIDPDDVRLSNSKRASLTARERAAATRGRQKGLHSPLRRPGKGVRDAAG